MTYLPKIQQGQYLDVYHTPFSPRSNAFTPVLNGEVSEDYTLFYKPASENLSFRGLSDQLCRGLHGLCVTVIAFPCAAMFLLYLGRLILFCSY